MGAPYLAGNVAVDEISVASKNISTDSSWAGFGINLTWV